MKTARMWMICFNDTKTFSEAFRNTNFPFKSNWFLVLVWFMYYNMVTWYMTWSRPSFPLWYHYLVHSENNSYFVVIVPICDVEHTCIFWPVFSFVHCIKDRYQYYTMIFITHLFSNVVIMTLNYVLCPILVKNLEKCTFWRYIYISHASTHSDDQQHHLTTLQLYHLHTENIEVCGSIRGRTIVAKGYCDSDLIRLDSVIIRQYTTVTNQC